MALDANSFGDLADVLVALGLAHPDGSLNGDWLSAPGDYLKTVLANDAQRQALLRLLEEKLEGDKETDSEGREWLPIIAANGDVARFFFVIDQSPVDHLRIGLGIRIKTTAPDTVTSFLLPLFRAGKDGNSFPDPVLIGHPGGAFVLTSEITISPAPVPPGAAGLRSVGLSFRVPTVDSDGAPSVALVLGGLQLPGGTEPADIALSVSDLGDLDDAALDLILGLIQARAGAAAGTQIAALAELLGLGGTIPPLPLDRLFTEGAGVLSEWFAAIVADPALKGAWLNAVAELLGGAGTATVSGETLSVNLGSASFELSVQSVMGSAGRPVVTPSVSFGQTNGNVRIECVADLFRLDLGSGEAVAVPSVRAQLRMGTPGSPLIGGDPSVQTLRAGLELDEARRPKVILALDQVAIGSNHYQMLDLSTPDALADVSGRLISDAVADLIANLGSGGAAVSVLLGIAPPAAAPGLPRIDLVAFMSNPLGALRNHWQELLSSHKSDVVHVLEALRQLVADAGLAGQPVTGDGSRDDPWRIALVGPAKLTLWTDDGKQLKIGFGVSLSQSDLGERCTVIETGINVSLADADLVHGTVAFATAAEIRADIRARGARRTAFGDEPVVLEADRITARVAWSVATGLVFSAAVPNPVLKYETVEIPLDIPAFDTGFQGLDDAQWEALEQLLGIFLTLGNDNWLSDAIHALGWRREVLIGGLPRSVRLPLAELVKDPGAALGKWLTRVMLNGGDELITLLQPLARIINGSENSLGSVSGSGRPQDPYVIPVLPVPGGPCLTAWVEPSGPPVGIGVRVSESFRSWRPGLPGLDPDALARALTAESAFVENLGSVFHTVDDLAGGFDALQTRWLGSDGRIPVPDVLPTGLLTQVMANVTAAGLRAQTDLQKLFGSLPDVILHIAVAKEGADWPFPDVPDAKRIDLRPTNRAPDTFSAPDGGPGIWYVALAPRADAKLATGDPDGAQGQAARLGRVLAGFVGVAGNVCVVADAASAHAAWIAVDRAGAGVVSQLVTLGMALSPVALSVLDIEPGASVLRLIGGLLPPEDPADPDDTDLAMARALVAALTDFPALTDPVAELSPPDGLPDAVAAGLDMRALYGRFDMAAIRRAMTAALSAGLSAILRDEFANGQKGIVTGAGIGLCFPVRAGSSGITIRGHVMLDLLGVDAPQGAAAERPRMRTAGSLHVRAEIRRTDGWIIGGPGSGANPQHELQWVEIDLDIPLQSGGRESASVILHDARIFGIFRNRWTLQAAAAAAGEGAITTALPEVEVLLSGLMSELAAETAPQIATLRSVMRAVGILDNAEALVADALDRLLFEPGAQIRDALTDRARLATLENAAAELFGGLPGVHIDLGTRSLSLELDGLSNDRFVRQWTLEASLDSDGMLSAGLSLGAPASGRLKLSTRPLAASFDIVSADAPLFEVALWPDPSAETLVGYAPHLVIGAAIKTGLDQTRRMDDSVRPLIDALLDVLGLLGSAGPDGIRPVMAPVSLLHDPAKWFRRASVFGAASGGLDAARIIQLTEALKPFLGVTGDAGVWQFTPGFGIAARGTGNEIDLAMELDSALFPTVPQHLVFGGSFGLRIAGGSPEPRADIHVGLPGAASGRRAVHLKIGNGVALFLRPAAGADISLYPETAGLGALASTAVEQALPRILNAVVTNGGDAGNITAVLGDILELRDVATAKFTSERLRAWASDPAGTFESRWRSMARTSLDRLKTALGPILPGSVVVVANDTGLVVHIGQFGLRLDTAPFAFGLSYAGNGLRMIRTVTADMVFDGTGLKELNASIGPAILPTGGVDLYPAFTISVGSAVATPSMTLGLALAANGTQSLGLRAQFDPVQLSVIYDDNGVVSTDPADLAGALLTLALDLLTDFVLQTQAVRNFLGKPVPGSGSKHIRDILEGVVLKQGDTGKVDRTLFRMVPPPGLDAALQRISRLVENFAEAGPSVNIDGIVDIGLAKTGNSVGLSLGLSGRFDLTTGDIVVSLENDSRWIKGGPQPGITLGILDLSAAPAFAPALEVDGVGVRISRRNGALVDTVLSLGSVALHFFGRVGSGPLAGGIQLQLSDLAVGVSGGTGGNSIANGIMGETATSGQELAPAFSPALAVQKDGNGPVMVSLSAGEGDGPWWLSVRKGFGPLYVDQVGLGVTVEQDQLKKISLFFDGNISIVGLTAAVDDLQLTFSVTSGVSFFEPSNWDIDLAGLAVSADLSGVTLSGGLRKYVDPSNADNIEYVGMLMARFATYGLSIYGGYASVRVDSGGDFTAFFAYGAIVGPFGGPPAFFLTGIGGGFGINRDIVVPTDLSAFDDFVMIKALDPSASPSDDPMAEMDSIRATFPVKQGQFWFAAGISFTSFAVVDGIAVVAVEFGDGFDLNIFGLARLALPRPQFPLVSIELGLVARFSTSEGVIWIQAQLTDNSWFLHESVRLTGGFAFVSWFGGPNKGQFVLTLGGYHPSFHRDGYPQVPRLGFHWQPINNIVIKGENYFALTSEAIMAGGALEASASFGPAWAKVTFGANVIIYFEPFRYEGDAHARISAGITIDVWIGKITISVSLGAKITVEGPEFHGRVTFEVGPVELEVEFGNSNQSAKAYLNWSEFVPKYLEEAAPGRAAVLSALTGKGSLPPGVDAAASSEGGTADGSVAHPYEVLSEFEISITTIMPANSMTVGTEVTREFSTSMALGLPPLNAMLSRSELKLSLREVGRSDELINDTGITTTARQTGNFPAGVWGPPQNASSKTVPRGEVISAVEGAHIRFRPQLVNRIDKEIAFNQVEAGPRQPLPFVQSRTTRPELLAQAQVLTDLVQAAPDVDKAFEFSREWMARSGMGATAGAALRRQRAAPPRLASLGERLDLPEAEAKKKKLEPAQPAAFDLAIRPPVAVGVFAAPLRVEVPPQRTTVTGAKNRRRTAPPTLAGIESRFDPAIAARLEFMTLVADNGETLISAGIVPVTRSARGNSAYVAGLGADAGTLERLRRLESEVAGGSSKGPRHEKPALGRATGGATLLPGEMALFDMPNARRAPGNVNSGSVSIAGGGASLIAFGAGGGLLLRVPAMAGTVKLPPQVTRFAVLATGDKPVNSGRPGWVGSRDLAFVGWSTAMFPGGTVFVEGASPGRQPERRGAGWIRASEFTGSGSVTTRFDKFARHVAVLFESAVSGENLADFALGIEGARENLRRPPLVVDLGRQTAVIFTLQRERGRGVGRRRGFSLRFASDAEGRITGVIAGSGKAEDLARDLRDQDPETLLISPVQGGGTPVRLKWRPNRKKGGRKKCADKTPEEVR